MGDSIFQNYYKKNILIDRKIIKGENGVDVILPILNTNELFETNLYSFYREIPINRLLIGDGGCTDDSTDIVQKFPRVTIYDQKEFKTLGYRIQDLIGQVSTDWFIYLHADVFLPKGWYDKMVKYQDQYDWYECYRKLTVLVEFWSEDQHKAERAFSGSQMGRTKAFKNILPKIDDDYSYRNEDIIFRELIETGGFKYARIPDTFHYHQLINKRGDKETKIKKVLIEKEIDKEWDKITFNMQARGIIKYLKPKSYLVDEVNMSLFNLWKLNDLDWPEFKKWVKETNPAWFKYVRWWGYLGKKSPCKEKLLLFTIEIYKRLKKQKQRKNEDP